MAVGDKWRVTAWATMGTQASANVRHYNVTAETGVGLTALQVANGFEALWRAIFIAVMSAQASWRGVFAQRIRPLPSGIGAGSTAAVAPGGVAGDALPKQTAALIGLVTAFAGRRFRGRVYIPFPGEASSESVGIPTAAYLTSLGAITTEMRLTRVIVVGADSDTFQPVIYGRARTAPPPLPEQFPVVTDSFNRLVWATQRRRGSFGRANVPPW